MGVINFLMAASVFFSGLYAASNGFPGEMVKHQTLECLYADAEQIILEDGSVWMPEGSVFLNKGDLVDIEGWYVQGNGKEEVDRKFTINGKTVFCTLDSFVKIEKTGVEKSYPFQLKIRIDSEGEVNEGFLGGQFVRTSENEILLWIAEGLVEENLSKGKEITFIKSKKGENKVLHTANGEWILPFHRIAKVKDPMLRKVISVEKDRVIFENVVILEDGSAVREETRIDFNPDFNGDVLKSIFEEIEECPIESFEVNISSFNPVICQIEVKGKEGESIIVKLSTDNEFRGQILLKDLNEELDVNVEFLAGSELADAFECGSYAVGDEFLVYPFTFYPIEGTEEFFSNISEVLGVKVDITEIEGIYLLERVQK